MDSASSLITIDLPGIEEKGLPIEAFAKVQEIFSNVGWLDPKADVALNMLQQITASNILERFDTGSPRSAEKEKMERESLSPQSAKKENFDSGSPRVSDNFITSSSTLALVEKSSPSFKSSTDLNFMTKKKIESQEPQVIVQRPALSKIISQRNPDSISSPDSSSNSLQGSPVTVSRYNSAPSVLGITALLHDHAESANKEASPKVTTSPASTGSALVPHVFKSGQPIKVSVPPLLLPSERQDSSVLPPAPPPPPPLPYHHLSASESSAVLLDDSYGTSLQDRGKLLSVHHTSPQPIPLSRASQSPSVRNSFPSPSPSPFSGNSISTPPPSQPSLPSSLRAVPSSNVKNSSSVPAPPPPPPPSSLGVVLSSTSKNSSSTPPLPPSPPPPPPPPSSSSSSLENSSSTPTRAPPPPPPPSFSRVVQLALEHASSTPPPPPPSSSSTPPPPPPLPGVASSPVPTKNSRAGAAPPPPPPPLHSGSSSAPPPPPPPGLAPKDNSSMPGPPVPPPPAPFANGLPKAGGPPHSAGSNGIAPPPPPFGAKGRLPSRTGPRGQPVKKNSLKPYHWLKLTRAMQGSLWAETQKSDEAGGPEFDMSELESLFSANPNSDSKGAKSNRRAAGPKSEKVNLVILVLQIFKSHSTFLFYYLPRINFFFNSSSEFRAVSSMTHQPT